MKKPHFFLRRLDSDVLDKKFIAALNKCSERYNSIKTNYPQSLTWFKNFVTATFIISLERMTSLEDENMANKIQDSLTDYYSDEIEERWNELQEFGIREHIKKTLREEVESTPTRFTYTTMRPFVKGATKKYYFNNILPVPDSSPILGSIKLEGPDGNFIFNKSVLKMELDKQKISIFQKDFNVSNSEHKSVNKTESTGINSKNIKLALEQAFPQYWNSENAIYSAGLRGIYTIGSKIGEPEQDWSIMNYFDTKAEIHDLLYSRFIEENPDEDIVDWMADVFRNDDDFTDELVKRQWKSIENGIMNEKKAIEVLISKLGSNNIIVYPFGSKMDRFGGIDVTIDGINYQIKPLSSYKETDGKYIVSTYGMRDYTNKTKLQKIVFFKGKTCLIFDNKNYSVPGKFTAIFTQKPEII